MFRVIGGAVVYGFALYGVVRLLDRPKVAVVVQAGAKPEDERGSESSADVAASHHLGKSTDPSGEASSGASTPADAVL